MISMIIVHKMKAAIKYWNTPSLTDFSFFLVEQILVSNEVVCGIKCKGVGYKA